MPFYCTPELIILSLKQLGRSSVNLVFFINILFFLTECISGQAGNWTQFRGSNLDGIAYPDSIPLKWDTAVKWKTEIHGRGYSSPVVFGNQIWITTSREDGSGLYAVCLDYRTGKIIYDIKVFSPEKISGKHSVNTFASPSPCIEDGFVYINYGSLGTACLNSNSGSVIWKRTDIKCDHVLGAGSSPVLYKNLLILNFDGSDVRFLIALDKSTGNTVWRTERPEKPYRSLSGIAGKSFTTPYLMSLGYRDLLVSGGSAVCCAYDPLKGAEVWRVTGGSESAVSMPFAENGIVYFYTGFMVDPLKHVYTNLLSVLPDGQGDVTNSKVLWKRSDAQVLNQILTPVIKDGLIYTITSKNILMCLNAKSGEEIWSVRLRAAYNSSPIYENGRVWFFSVKGDAIAIRAGRKYELIAKNVMDSGIWATPAFVRNSVILRTGRYLYRIG